jgi:hypothetical protein
VHDASDLAAGTISGSIKADAYVSAKFDENQIKDELIGKSDSGADQYLKSLEGVKETKLEFFPSFLKIFPRIKDHIFLIINVANRGA